MPDGSTIIVGHAGGSSGDVTGFYGNIDAWVVKLDTTGAVLNWAKTFGGGSVEKFNSVIYANGALGCVGSTNSITNDLAVTRTTTDFDWWVAELK